MQALVTGAGGFIGSHLFGSLREIHSAQRFSGDLRKVAAFEDVERADVVYHLAAISNVPASLRDPLTAWQVNADGTLRLLEWARRTDAGRLVIVSTAHVYGPARYSPIDEAHPTLPISPYGASKLAAEAMARAYCASYGLDVVVVRPFNIYGPGQGEGFLIPDILLQLHQGKTLVLGDPRPVRDFTYIDDAVDFLLRAGEAPAAKGETMNLGTGRGHSVAEVAEAAARVSGAEVKPVYDEHRFRAVETMELVVDNRKAVQLLGWSPAVGLEEGLRRTWESLREQ